MKSLASMLGIVLAQACPAAGEAPPAHAAAGIGYPSVEAAFRALKADPHAVVAVEGEWMLFTQTEGAVTTSWRFTRPGHAAHPSVLRKRVDQASGMIEKSSLCQSIQSGACATLQDGQ